jgi:hypothetical protein
MVVGASTHRRYTEDHSRDQRLEIQMSRFAVVYEDPDYEEPVGQDWADTLDGFVTVAEKPQESEDIMDWLNQKLVDI